MPKVSVVMSVFNQEKYLPIAIESILNQTYTDFEFIIVNDGSNDSSNDIILGYKDKRIILIEQENTGLPVALNLAISKTKGDFIARMDSDDISHPSRLKKQLEHLKQNPEMDLIGSSVRIIDENGKFLGVEDVPTSTEAINQCLKYRCVVYHPTFFIRKEIFNKVGGYRKEFIHAQDYDFLLRARSKNINIANQADYLLDYRVESKSSFVKDFNQSRFARLARELDRERNKYGSESDNTFSQVKKIENISSYQYFLHKSFLNLASLTNKLKGSKRHIVRILSILIGVFTQEARNEIFRDLMYYQVLKKSNNKYIDIFYIGRN